MKKVVVTLVVTLAISLAAFPAAAQIFPVCLEADGFTLELYLEQVAPRLFATTGTLSGPGQLTNLSGVTRLGGGEANITFDLQQAGTFVPVIWDLTLNLPSRTGSGNFQWLTSGEASGPINSVQPCGSPVRSGPVNLEAIGIAP